jgi:hypothetical protein
MSGMIRASIRWSLVGLLLLVSVPVPGGAGPVAKRVSRAACCAPKACCTADHACAGGGACAAKDAAMAVSHGGTGTSTPALRAGICHPEAARLGTSPTLDPVVFASLPGHPGGVLFAKSRADEARDPASRFSTPQVPPPRA